MNMEDKALPSSFFAWFMDDPLVMKCGNSDGDGGLQRVLPAMPPPMPTGMQHRACQNARMLAIQGVTVFPAQK
jgi:hypothetical protein